MNHAFEVPSYMRSCKPRARMSIITFTGVRSDKNKLPDSEQRYCIRGVCIQLILLTTGYVFISTISPFPVP